MKKALLLSLVVLSGCGVPQSDYNKLKSEYKSLNDINQEQSAIIQALRDSVSMLSYPADQRYNHILELINRKDYSKAKEEIIDIMTIFPHSTEAGKCPEQLKIIKKRIAEQKAEEERVKAMGFKAFKDNTIININNKTCKYSGFNYGRTYTSDYCSDVNEYSYRTADKDKTYILVSLNMSTKEKSAVTPTMKVYKIANGKLKEIGDFMEEYATWTSYGAKIGNYSDDSHDFSKVNSINYKMASEISIEDSKKPLLLLISKDKKNIGDNLTIEDVQNNCIVVKVLNRNKL